MTSPPSAAYVPCPVVKLVRSGASLASSMACPTEFSPATTSAAWPGSMGPPSASRSAPGIALSSSPLSVAPNPPTTAPASAERRIDGGNITPWTAPTTSPRDAQRPAVDSPLTTCTWPCSARKTTVVSNRPPCRTSAGPSTVRWPASAAASSAWASSWMNTRPDSTLSSPRSVRVFPGLSASGRRPGQRHWFAVSRSLGPGSPPGRRRVVTSAGVAPRPGRAARTAPGRRGRPAGR